MPIGPFENFDSCVAHFAGMGDSDEVARKKCGSMERMGSINAYQKGDGFFIKAFLLDNSQNVNRWGVTAEALQSDLQTFVGKPFVVTPDFRHPREEYQEDYRKGNIDEVGIDGATGKAYAVIRVTDEATIEQLRRGDIRFVSPSIGVSEGDERAEYSASGELLMRTIHRFTGYHIAGVREPAFGVYKAQIKGHCSGPESECKRRLMFVQACKGCTSERTAAEPTGQDVDEAINWLKKAIARHERHMNGTEPTSDASQMKMMDEMKKALAKLTGVAAENEASVAHNSHYCSNATSELFMGEKPDYDSEHVSIEKLHAQVADLTAKLGVYENSSKEDKQTISGLKAQLEAEIKRPVIERILAARTELGEIKAEERQAEADKLGKKDADTLNYIASTLEAFAKKQKDAQASPTYRFHRASAEADEKLGDRELLKLRGGF